MASRLPAPVEASEIVLLWMHPDYQYICDNKESFTFSETSHPHDELVPPAQYDQVLYMIETTDDQKTAYWVGKIEAPELTLKPTVSSGLKMG